MSAKNNDVTVDTSVLYNDTEQAMIDHSLGIMNHLLSRYNNPSELDRMSIDKTDSILRIVESSTKLVNTLATTKLRLMSMKSESDDRSRLLSILTDVNARKQLAAPVNRATEITDVDVSSVDVNMVRGELTTGVEQLSLELLEYERGTIND